MRERGFKKLGPVFVVAVRELGVDTQQVKEITAHWAQKMSHTTTYYPHTLALFYQQKSWIKVL